MHMVAKGKIKEIAEIIYVMDGCEHTSVDVINLEGFPDHVDSSLHFFCRVSAFHFLAIVTSLSSG